MIERYSDPRIAGMWEISTRYGEWQKVELAVIAAREGLGRIPAGTHKKIADILFQNQIDVDFIDEREQILQHDLNAFLEERMRFLPAELQTEFHLSMTSYDTEESVFIWILAMSCSYVSKDLKGLLENLEVLARKYRYTPMNARTHGQEAEMQSFGKRCLTWYTDLRVAEKTFLQTLDNLRFSKLSGAIGTNSGIDPKLEKAALAILNFEPWAGATQIMPRIIYAPIASALADLAAVIEKIATDIRLGARSGRPLWHEPFGKKQKGSSAMPHKKNTILCENICGMAIMARALASGIRETIKTWEERAIEQSSVERVFWPDLFHVTLRAIKNIKKVVKGLVVYPDTMMVEILESRGTYASNAAKEFLVNVGAGHGLNREATYRIVQLACFNAFAPTTMATQEDRNNPPSSLYKADLHLTRIRNEPGLKAASFTSIKHIIPEGRLVVHPDLDTDEKMVTIWNKKLLKIFGREDSKVREQWEELFRPSYILKNEAHLFQTVFGE